MEKREEIIRYRIRKAKEELKNSELSFINSLYNPCVSSSYFAIFHAARALLAAKGLVSKKHAGVIHLFSAHFIRPGLINPEYGKMIRSAFEQRNNSDYADMYYVDNQQAEIQLTNAKEFLKMAESFLSSEYGIKV
ncbi:MAG: HEPN domain-containing protein [Ignavibacteriaceae bacterium]|nr:HEPN domain-containing protein [Ignavibacteriaceae bacterium]